MTLNTHNKSAHLAALESRLGMQLAARLSDGAEQLPHDVSERLRFARGLAVSRLKHAPAMQTAVQGAGVLATAGASLGSGSSGNSGWWRPAVSTLQALVLVGGFFLIGHLHSQAQISAAAEIDAALLADDLPPEAYNDPGFVEFLKTSLD